MKVTLTCAGNSKAFQLHHVQGIADVQMSTGGDTANISGILKGDNLRLRNVSTPPSGAMTISGSLADTALARTVTVTDAEGAVLATGSVAAGGGAFGPFTGVPIESTVTVS